ncbi:T-cell-specific surface glycoprotein CD28-like [Nelusetta ayraudi]|uniref:T-cell-specific surface glycoprotein CD28-like n=1 Tax=Nelusetta ayraudi TaxID=303726 RepID=UPI003F714BDA
MEMKLLRVFVMLACCSLFHAAESDSRCCCHKHVKTVRVPAGQDVLVPCPNVTSSVMNFKLHLNGELIHTERFPHKGQRGDREMRVVNGNGTFDLWIGRVNSSSHDVYWCEVDVIYPPPMVTQCSSQWILPQVEDHQSTGSREEDEEVHRLLIWIPIVATVSLYGLIVTAVLFVSCVRLRTMDSDGEYMNTKPPAPRAHWWKA